MCRRQALLPTDEGWKLPNNVSISFFFPAKEARVAALTPQAVPGHVGDSLTKTQLKQKQKHIVFALCTLNVNSLCRNEIFKQTALICEWKGRLQKTNHIQCMCPLRPWKSVPGRDEL